MFTKFVLRLVCFVSISWILQIDGQLRQNSSIQVQISDPFPHFGRNYSMNYVTDEDKEKVWMFTTQPFMGRKMPDHSFFDPTFDWNPTKKLRQHYETSSKAMYKPYHHDYNLNKLVDHHSMYSKFRLQNFLNNVHESVEKNTPETFRMFDEQLYQCVLLPKVAKYAYSNDDNDELKYDKVYQLYGIDMDKVKQEEKVSNYPEHYQNVPGKHNKHLYHMDEYEHKDKYLDNPKPHDPNVDAVLKGWRTTLNQVMCQQGGICYGGVMAEDINSDSLIRFAKHVYMTKKLFDMFEKNNDHLPDPVHYHDSHHRQVLSSEPATKLPKGQQNKTPPVRSQRLYATSPPSLYDSNQDDPYVYTSSKRSFLVNKNTRDRMEHYTQNEPFGASRWPNSKRRKTLQLATPAKDHSGISVNGGQKLNRVLNNLQSWFQHWKQRTERTFSSSTAATSNSLVSNRHNNLINRHSFTRPVKSANSLSYSSIQTAPLPTAIKLRWPKPVLVIKEYEEYNE